MTDDIIYTSLSNQLTEVRGKVEHLDKDLGALRTEVGGLRSEMQVVRDTNKEIAGGVRAIKFGLIGGALFIAGLVGFAGKSVIRDIAREVVDEQIAKVQSFSQVGRFTSANRIAEAPGEFPVYRWSLSTPVASGSVIAVTAEPMEFVGPMSVSAQLGPDGNDCLMTVRGTPEVLEQIESMGINAKVTVIYRNALAD